MFCGPCLRNRYGEDAKTALKNPVSIESAYENGYLLSDVNISSAGIMKS